MQKRKKRKKHNVYIVRGGWQAFFLGYTMLLESHEMEGNTFHLDHRVAGNFSLICLKEGLSFDPFWMKNIIHHLIVD